MLRVQGLGFRGKRGPLPLSPSWKPSTLWPFVGSGEASLLLGRRKNFSGAVKNCGPSIGAFGKFKPIA